MIALSFLELAEEDWFDQAYFFIIATWLAQRN